MQSSVNMTLGERLKALRQEIGLSQEAVGSQGFVSTPGWIKIENGQRQASEKLIEKLTRWLVDDKYMPAKAANTLKEGLLVLKYLGNRSVFVQEMAKARAKGLPDGGVKLLAELPKSSKPKRGRPPGIRMGGGIALVAETPENVYKAKRRRK